MKMDDDGEQDDKVIAVPIEDPRYDHIEDLDDIPQQTLDEIDEFFSTYKNLEEGKEVETLAGRTKKPQRTLLSTPRNCTTKSSTDASGTTFLRFCSTAAVFPEVIPAGVSDYV